MLEGIEIYPSIHNLQIWWVFHSVIIQNSQNIQCFFIMLFDDMVYPKNILCAIIQVKYCQCEKWLNKIMYLEQFQLKQFWRHYLVPLLLSLQKPEQNTRLEIPNHPKCKRKLYLIADEQDTAVMPLHSSQFSCIQL